MASSAVPGIRVTGQQTGPGGIIRIEVEVQGGNPRVRFAQGPGPLPDSRVGALIVDELPNVVVLHAGAESGLLAFAGQRPAPLPAVPLDAPRIDEAHVLTLAPLLSTFAAGLYTIGVWGTATSPRGQRGWRGTTSGLVNPGVGADAGAPVVASLGAGSGVLVAGRVAAWQRRPAWVVTADVVLHAPGFEPRHHDAGAREAFARSPDGVLSDAALRNAVALHQSEGLGEGAGQFTEDRVEPAAQQARALAWDLRVEDGIDGVGEIERVVIADVTEYRSMVRVKGVRFELAFVSHDGRRVDEALVRSGGRFRATGLRPAARTLARTLRQLADEGP